jgi:AAA domain
MSKNNNPAGNIAPIRWDNPQIETELIDTPDEAKAAYKAVKVLAREQFARDLGRFSAHASRLGIGITRRNWSMILRGRGWTDSRHNPDPVVSTPTFLEAAEALMKHQAEREMVGRGRFIWTSAAVEIRDYIEMRGAPWSRNRWGVVVGETGLGKSATANELKRLWPDRFRMLECPESASRAELVKCMAWRYGYSLSVSPATMKENLFTTVRPEDIWWFDNAQRLFSRETNNAAVEFLIRLQEQTRFVPILSFTPVEEKRVRLEAVEAWWEQIEGRTGGSDTWCRLPEYPSPDDAVLIAQDYGVENAAKHRTEIHSLALREGRIRILFEVLGKAATSARAEDRAPTIEDVRTFAPRAPVARRERRAA